MTPLSTGGLSLSLYHYLQYNFQFFCPSRHFCKVEKRLVDRQRWTTCIRVLVEAHEAWRGVTAIVLLASWRLVIVVIVGVFSLLLSLASWYLIVVVVIDARFDDMGGKTCACEKARPIDRERDIITSLDPIMLDPCGPVGLKTFWTRIWYPIYLNQFSEYWMRWLKSVLM